MKRASKIVACLLALVAIAAAGFAVGTSQSKAALRLCAETFALDCSGDMSAALEIARLVEMREWSAILETAHRAMATAYTLGEDCRYIEPETCDHLSNVRDTVGGYAQDRGVNLPALSHATPEG